MTNYTTIKMKLLLFDTETTGLPKSREPANKGPNNWPHLVSIAWIVIEDDVILKSEYHIVKPEWVIPADSTAIHGITQEQAIKDGKPLCEVISLFMSEEHDKLVAHNMNFDMNVLVNAMVWDLKLPHPIFKDTFCTMETSRIMCHIPFTNGRPGYKPPKLSELYEFIMHKVPVPTELHNSLYDVKLLSEIVLNSVGLRTMLGLKSDKLVNVNARKKMRTTLYL
jgi:DNA polymerase III epsilon subunit-like protein